MSICNIWNKSGFIFFVILFFSDSNSNAQYIISDSGPFADYEISINSPSSNENTSAECFVYSLKKNSNRDIPLFVTDRLNPLYSSKSVLICENCISYDKSIYVNKFLSISPDIYITLFSSAYHRSTIFYSVDNINLAEAVLVIPPNLILKYFADKIIFMEFLMKNYGNGIKSPLEDYLKLRKISEFTETVGYKSKVLWGKITEKVADYLVIDDKVILKSTNNYFNELKKNDLIYLYFNGYYWEVACEGKDSYSVEIIYCPHDINFVDCKKSYFEPIDYKRGLIRDVDNRFVYQLELSQLTHFMPTFLGDTGLIIADTKIIFTKWRAVILNVNLKKKK